MLLALVAWGFINQAHPFSLFIPETLVADWQQKQIQDPYGASLPWIIIPRTTQTEIVNFIKKMSPESHVYFLGAHKVAELPPLTGRINYPLERRQLMSPQQHDVLILGTSVVSPWMSPLNRRKGDLFAQQQCRRPLIENDFYRICGLTSPTAGGIPDFTPREANFQNGIELRGFDAFKTTYRPGESLQVSLFWQAAQPIRERYKAFVRLVGSQWNPSTNNPLWGQLDHDPGDGSTQTTKWTVGNIVEDQYLFHVASNTPSGTYQIEVGMYLASSGERTPILTKDGIVDHVILLDLEMQPLQLPRQPSSN
jgi:hypothetical protein